MINFQEKFAYKPIYAELMLFQKTTWMDGRKDCIKLKTQHNKKSKRTNDSHSHAKLQTKEILVMSVIHTGHTKHTLLVLFKMYSNHTLLNFSGSNSKKQFAVYDSDIPVTLKQGQGHQFWYELPAAEQGYTYNHAQFERPPLNSVIQKVNVKSFLSNQKPCQLSLKYVKKKGEKTQWCIHCLLDLLNNPTKFNLIG